MNYSIKILNIYHKLRILSIDVVLGALSVALMSVKVLAVQMEIAWWFVLPAAVWIVYTADHLIDSAKLGEGASSTRRLFYHKYFLPILIIEIILIIITSLVSVLFLKNEIILFGIALGLFVSIYLLLVHKKGSEKLMCLQKELIVAIVYTVGIWGGPVLCRLHTIGLYEIILVILFFLITWADILIIAQFEIENDKQDNFTSLPLIIGREKNVKLINSILIISVFSLLVFILFQENNLRMALSGIILFVMSFVLFVLLRFESSLKKNDYYRILAESVFFLPALMVFV